MAELGEFVKHNEGLKALDVQMLAVSVDPPDKGRETQQKLNVPFPVLSDSKLEAMEAYGTRFPRPGPGGSTINTPTLVLIDRTGKIVWIHQAENFRIRAPFSQVLEEINKLEKLK